MRYAPAAQTVVPSQTQAVAPAFGILLVPHKEGIIAYPFRVPLGHAYPEGQVVQTPLTGP